MITASLLGDKPFATSISGYLTAIWLFVVTVMVPVFASRVYARIDAREERISHRLDTQDTTMAAHTQALALLVQSFDNASATLLRVPTLESSLAVLRDRLEQHEKWASQSRTELLDGQRRD